MIKLFLPLLLAATLSASADSFVYMSNGQCITEGAPVNVKALRSTYRGSFFWFSIAGKSYITRDAKVLRRLKDVYAPLFTEPVKDYSSRIDDINRHIELQLHDIGVQLVREKIAVPVR